MYVCESLIYAIWSCEELGWLQIDVASPHQISLCPLLAMPPQIFAWPPIALPPVFFHNFPFKFVWLTYTIENFSASNISNDNLETLLPAFSIS